MKFVRDNVSILFRTFYFPLPQHKSKCTTYKLEILRPVCTHAIVMCSLPKENLPLTPEPRLGSWAPGSEMHTLQVSPVAGLSAQVSMCLIHVGACAAVGQGPDFMGLLFLWGWIWQRGWHPGSFREELVPHGAWVTWKWGPHGRLGEGV